MESQDVEDHGDWLGFGLPHAGTTIPVRISREAMEEYFGAVQEPESLKKAYARDAQMIQARAADLVVPGVSYTADNPLVLNMEDF
ncbi:MAG: hypothetical protein ABIR76_09360 [Polaromonas sp.]